MKILYVLTSMCALYVLTSCTSAHDSPEIATDEPLVVTDVVDQNEATGVVARETEKQPGGQALFIPTDTPVGLVSGGLYLPYTPTALAQSGGKVILFFSANWSPASINLDKDITKNSDKIPADVTILHVQFDQEQGLRDQYGVSKEQTFVEVTNTGEMIRKWRGAMTLEDIVRQINASN